MLSNRASMVPPIGTLPREGGSRGRANYEGLEVGEEGGASDDGMVDFGGFEGGWVGGFRGGEGLPSGQGSR